MAANEFLLQILGEDVSPQSVDVEDLTGVIRGFRGALASIASASGADEEDVLLALTNVSGGSNQANGVDRLTLYGSEASIKSAKRLVRLLNSAKQWELPLAAQGHLRNIWKMLYRNGWDACQFEGNGSQIGTASIQRENELFPEPGTYRGDTVIYGECTRTGGEGRRSATLRLLNGERLTVRLRTKELAAQLGKRLYQTVGLQGEAIWLSESNKLTEFRADSLTDFTDRDAGATAPRSVADAFQELSSAAGDRWEHVDPEEFVWEQRRD